MFMLRKSLINAEGYDIPQFLKEYKLKLDGNENIIGPSPKVLEALKNIQEKDIKFYPAYGEVLKKLSKFHNISPYMVLPANGADEVISYIFDTFIEPQDTVLTVIPTFVMPKIYAKTLGCTYKEVPYEKRWVYPVDELIQEIDENTKLIIVTTPNNPTGEAVSRQDILKILKAAGERLILIDETYANYAGDSFANLLQEFPNIIIAKSTSKDFGLAGLRFGYALASRELIGFMKKVIRPYSVNNLASKAVCAALDDIEHLNNVISEIRESRAILSEGLKPYAERVFKSDANFILCDFGKKADFIYKKLLNFSIKVKTFKEVPYLEDCLRITVPSVKDTYYILESLKKRDLIIFDMDGVIVDTRNSYRQAIKRTYEYFAGKSPSQEQVQHAKNQGGLNNDWDLTFYLLEKAGIEVNFVDIIEKFQDLYWGKNGNGYIINETLLIKPELIAELAQKYDLAIFTGRPKLEAEFVLKKWGLEDYFSPIITMEDVPKGYHKPDPWGVFKILEVTSPLNVYYLGDTIDDMIAAQKAKVIGIGVLPPQDKTLELKERLLNHGAKFVIQNTEDILEILTPIAK